jgi:integrase/recombinase XerD
MAEAWDLNRDMVLSSEEVNALFGHLQTRVQSTDGPDRDAARLDELVVSALVLSGLRNSEFCGLTVGDTVLGVGDSVLVVRRREGASRTVYIPQHVSGLIEAYVDQVRPGFLPREVDGQDLGQPLVFNERRRPYERTGLYRRVVGVLTEAGLGERASVQLLRHTYGYLAYLRTGGNLLFVQRQLGHAHPRITSVYARLVEESYPELAERVAGASEVRSPAPGEGVYAPCRPAFDCEMD